MCELLGVSHTFLKEGKKTQKSQRICCLYSETRTAQSSQSGNLCAFFSFRIWKLCYSFFSGRSEQDAGRDNGTKNVESSLLVRQKALVCFVNAKMVVFIHWLVYN